MITLVGGRVQNQGGIAVANGSISLQLNMDATIVAPPSGLLPSEQELVFQFDDTGNLVQPCLIWSNAELNPQNSSGLGTYYLVTLYNANGTRINKSPLWWQFSNAAGDTVDISFMTAISTIGRNVIFYPAISGSVLNLSFADISGIAGLAQGGTGEDFSGTGGSNKILRQNILGGPITVDTIASINLSDFSAAPPTHSGEIPIWDAASATYIPGDPFVQGVYVPGTNVTTGGISSGPIKPVLIGGSDYAGAPLLHDLKVDALGQIYIGASTNVIGKVSQDTSPWVVSGAVTEASLDAAIATTAASVPAKTVQVGGSDGTKLRPLATDPYGRLIPVDISTLGDSITSARYNQMEINFSQGFDVALITNTLSTGTATAASGCAAYATTTAGTAEAAGVSVQVLGYRPGHEWYANFTASFTTPTDASATNYQRIGPYSATDGFYIGYEKTTFGVTQRQNSVDAQTPKASWNGDPVDGSAGSKFTSAGAPVALNLATINVYRFTGAWHGASPMYLEVLSPDGVWVNLHTYRFPNTLTTPFIWTTTLPITIDVKKVSSDATNLIVKTASWALGTCDNSVKITDTITDNSLAPLTRSVIAGHTTAGGGAYVNVKVNPSGALTADVSNSTGLVLGAGTAAVGVVSTKTALTPSAPTAASVGVVSAQAVASAATRKGITLVNTSANYISLGFGANAAVLYSGITLNPNGGTYVMGEYDFYTGAINAIASAATSNLAIQEYTS